MYQLKYTNKFKKDVKRAAKRGYDIRYILFLLFCPFFMFGQIETTINLKKDCKIDTLYVFLQQTDTSDYELNEILHRKFDSIVANFNTQQGRVFKIIIDSTHFTNTIKFVMGKINYVGCKRRVLTATLDIVGLGLDILIFPYFPFPIFPFYLMPATVCQFNIVVTNDLAKKNGKLFVNPNGTFIKKDKQKEKFKKCFDKEFVNCFNEIEKQYKKNNKRNRF